MSIEIPEAATWSEVLDAKAKLVYQQIAALQRWNEDAGGDAEMLSRLCEPYYASLRSIYEEDYPLAHAIDASDLLIHLKGPAVDQLNPRLSLIAGVFSNVRKQVGSVAFAIAGVMSRSSLPKDVDLGLSGFAPGSLYLGFAVPDPETEDEEGYARMFGADDPLYLATKQALRTIGIVTHSLSSDNPKQELAEKIPDPKVRDTALAAVQKIAPSGKTGVNSIGIGGKGFGSNEVTLLTPSIRSQMLEMIKNPVTSEERDTFEGVVREIDLDLRRFELRRIVNYSLEDIRCIYDETKDDKAETYLNKRVSVYGKVERSMDGTARLVEVETVTILTASFPYLAENNSGST